MKCLLKWIAIIIVLIIVVVIIGISCILFIAPNYVDTAGFKVPIEKYLSKATGRPVSIDDDIKLRMFPWAHVSLSNLQVGNSKEFGDTKLLSLKAEEVDIKLLPSLSPRGILQIFEQLNASQNPGDTDEASSSNKSDARDLAEFMVDKITITNGVLTITDKKNDSSRSISNLNLTLYDVNFKRPVGVSLSANVGDVPTLIKGHIGPIGDTPGKDPIAINLLVTALDQLQVQVSGTVDNALDAPSADLTLEVVEFSPRLLAKKLGLPPSVADNSAVLNSLSLKAHLTGGTHSLAIDHGILILDESIMHFTSEARNFDKPNIGFDFSLDQFNLDRYLPQNQEDANARLQTFLMNSSTYYAPLRKMVLDGKVSIDDLIINNEKIDNTTFHITSQKGLLKIDPN